jgi:hypothetical protein
LTTNTHAGSGTGAASRRSLLARGAAGLLAGGAVVTAADVVGASPAAAAGTGTATPDWINVTSAPYLADPTGSADSTAAFRSAIAAAASAGGGVVYIPAGTYVISSTLTCTAVPVYFVGDGAWASVISFTGTGDCLRVYDGSAYGSRTKKSGGVIGLTIDGAKAGPNSSGLHVGDLLQYEIDATVQNFTGAGSIGVHLDNNYYWAEQLHGRIYAQNCASHVVFDVTTGVASTVTGSFERCDLDVYIDQWNAAFDGVVFRNGAFIANGSLKLRGNFAGGPTPVSSAALRLTGYQTVDGTPNYSGIVDSTIDVGVECGQGAYSPQTIAFGGAGNVISRCAGLLNFGAAGTTFTASNNDKNIFAFLGHTGGDSTLPGDWATYNSGFPAGVTGHVAFRFLPTGNEVMVSWAFDIASGTVVGSGQVFATVNPRFAFDDNKIIFGNNSGGGLNGNVYAPAYLSSNAEFKYAGPAYTSSGTSWWYGQGIYTLSLG